MNTISFIFILSCLYLSQEITLHSKDIHADKEIAQMFTPFGRDINPSFSWDNVNNNVKSFAFSVEDPDAPIGLFYHWILINIPKNTRKITQGKFPGRAIKNTWGITKYKGPKPPSGTHHYHFVIYGLDVETINVRSYEDFKTEINKHLVEKSEIVSWFSYKGDL